MADNNPPKKTPAKAKPAGAFSLDPTTLAQHLSTARDGGMTTLKADKSKYDEGFIISGNDPLGDLQEQRAQRQSGWEQLGFGVSKGLVLAGTTVVDSLIGLPVGLASAAGAGLSGKSAGEAFSKIYDNPITNAMEEFNKASEEYLPNYYTKKELNADAFSTDNWATANFLGDKLLKNAGFTVGAMVSGNLVAKGAAALGKIAMGGKIAQELAQVKKLADGGMELAKAFDKVAKTTKMVNSASRGSAALVAATGEASAEALQAKEETKAAILEKMTMRAAAQGRKITEQEMQEAERLSSAAGNTVMGMNIPLLMASDLIQFGKVLGGGFNKEMRALSAGRYTPILKEGVYEAGKATGKQKAGTIAGKLLLDPLSESFEEGAQTAIQAGSKDYALRKYDKPQGDYFHNLMASTLTGLEETFGTKEGREGMLLGFLTGNISHLATGGVKQDMADMAAKEANSKEAADFLNNWREKSGGKALLESAIRSRSIAADMDESLAAGDKFQYKNLEHDQLKNYVQASITRGTYDLLLEKLEEQKSMSPEDFKEAYGVDADIQSVDQYISKIQGQVKSLKEVYDQVQTRFPQASTAVKEAFFDGISSVRDLEKRELELNQEAISPAGKTNAHIKGVDLLMLKKSTELAGTDYEAALQEATKDLAPDVANTIWEAANEVEKIRARKASFGRIYNALLTPEGQAVVEAQQAQAAQAAAQPTPAPAPVATQAPAPVVPAPAPAATVQNPIATPPVIGKVAPPKLGNQPAAAAPVVGNSTIISPSTGKPYLAGTMWTKPLAELATGGNGNKILPKVDIGSSAGAELDPVTGKVVKYFDNVNGKDLKFAETDAVYGKLLERFQQEAQAAPAPAPVVAPAPAQAPASAPTTTQAPAPPAGPRTIMERLQDLKADIQAGMQETFPGEAEGLLRAIQSMEHGGWSFPSGGHLSKQAIALAKLVQDRQIEENNKRAAQMGAAAPAPATPVKDYNWQPQDYKYAQITSDKGAFTGDDLKDQPLRDEWVKRMKNPAHSQNSVEVTVVKENGYQYNLYTELDGKKFKLGYLKTTEGKRALPATATQETAAAFRQIVAVKEAIAADKGPVKLLFQVKTTLDTKAVNKTSKSLAELDERFTFEGQHVVIAQRKPGSLAPFTSELGKHTAEDEAAIQKLGLTDGYIVKVSQPAGNDGSVAVPRYLAAKTLPATAAEYAEVSAALKQGNEKLAAKIINENLFVAAKQPKTHIKAVGTNFEVLANDENNSKLGYLRFKKDATFTDEASFMAALEFTPVGKNPVAVPAENYISSVRQQIKSTDTQQQVLEKLLPAVSEELFGSLAIEPVGIDVAAKEPAKLAALLPAAPVAIVTPEAVGAKPAEQGGMDLDELDEEAPQVDIALKVLADEVVASTDYKQAAKNLARLLPAEFSLQKLENLAKSVYGTGNIMAAYVDMNIYLAEATEKGVEYHEAFHAVFRALMSKEEQRKYYAIADRQFKVSKGDIEKFKKSAPQYANLSTVEARYLLLEEKMADAFQGYMNGKPTTLLGKAFAFLKKMVSFFSQNRDELKALFMKIDNGGFKHAMLRRATGFEKEAAYKVIPRMSVEQSQKAVRLLAVRFAKAKQVQFPGGATREEKEELLEKLILERAKEDTVEGTYDISQLKQLNLFSPSAEAAAKAGLEAGKNYHGGYLYKDSKAVLKEMILKQDAYLSYVVQQREEEADLEDEEQDGADADDVNAAKEKIGSGGILEVNSVKNVSQEIRQIISYTTYGEGKDEQAVDFGQTVSVLERILENVRSFEEMKAKVEARIQDGENAQLKAVWENLQPHFSSEAGELYKRKFQQGFYRILVNPLQLTVETATSKAELFSANQRDIAKERVGQFRNAWNVTRASHAEGVAELKVLAPKLAALATEDMEAAMLVADDIAVALNKLGVDLSKTFLRSVVRGTNENYKLRKAAKPDGKGNYYGLLDQLSSIVQQHSLGRNPFDGERAEGQKQGATYVAGILAAEDANWRDTILNPSYKNAEKKSQYAYTQPSFVLERARDLQDGKLNTEGAYMALNALVKLNVADKGATFSSLATGVFSGIRVKEAGDGQTFGNLDVKTFFLSVYAAYQNGYAMPFQFESKSTTLLTKMPEWSKCHYFAGGAITEAGLSDLRDMVAQELLAIEDTFSQLEGKDAAWLKQNAVKNRHFTKWKDGVPVIMTREQVDAAKASGNLKGVPRGMVVTRFPDLATWSTADLQNKEKLNTYFKGFVDKLIQEHSAQLKQAGWDTADKKTQKLLMGKIPAQSWQEFMGEFLLRDFIFVDAYSQLVRGSEDYFKDGVDITKRAAGMLAAGPALGDGSFNMAMLQTDGFHIYKDTLMPVSEEDQALLDGKEMSSGKVVRNQDGEVLAENGQPSNLYKKIGSITSSEKEAEAIYLGTKTLEFKKWFGDSSVADGNGEPVLMFHIGAKGIKKFSKDFFGKGEGSNTLGNGFYFSPQPAIGGGGFNAYDDYYYESEEPTRAMLEDGILYPVFLRASNMLDEQGVRGDSTASIAKKANGYDGINALVDYGQGDEFLGGEVVVFEPEQIKFAFDVKAKPTKQRELLPSDKIIFGHPTIGKTFLKTSEKYKDSFISMDDDYAQDIKDFIAKNKKPTEDKYQYQERKPEEFISYTLSLFDKAKALAKKEGKMLFTSNGIVLDKRAGDFDKIINLSKEEFFRRIGERNTTYDVAAWKSQIEAMVAKAAPEKVINTDGYLEDLLPGSTLKKLQESTVAVDATDAQGYITGKRFKHIMQQQARISVEGLKAIDKVIAGEPLETSEQKAFVANSIKNIYYGQEPDGSQTYIKTSVIALFKEFTSFKVSRKQASEPGQVLLPEEAIKGFLRKGTDVGPDEICNATAELGIQHLKSLGYDVSPIMFSLKAKSPIGDFQIGHFAALARIGEKFYLYDMPQGEFLSGKSNSRMVQVTEDYKPRFIELTEENLKNLYGTENPKREVEKLTKKGSTSWMKHAQRDGMSLNAIDDALANGSAESLADWFTNKYGSPKTAEATAERWVAKPGMEKWHNLREKMEAIDGETGAEAYHETAVKLGQRAMNFRNEDGTHGDLLHRPLANSNWRLQVENPSGKDKITDGTQLLQILDSGMKDTDTFEYQGKETTVGDLRNEYQKVLAQLRIASETKFSALQDMLIDGVNLYKDGLVASLEASNTDQNTLDFFKTNNGEWVMSTDLPAIQQKFQEMVLSSWNKNVFSQKVPGRKLSLVTSAMANTVINKETGELAHDWSKPFSEQAYMDEEGNLLPEYTTRRLGMHHRTVDGKRIVEAEVILSEEILMQRGITLADLYGPGTSDATRKAILQELGFRIPSQDKHSVIPYRIVGWVPAYMGSIVIAPAQITYLSGADYDIDSLYVVRREFYKTKKGVKLYGQSAAEGDMKGMWGEYLAYNEKNNAPYMRITQQRERDSAELSSALRLAASLEGEAKDAAKAEVSKIRAAIREQVREEIGMAKNFAYFSKSPKTTPYALQNKLMDARMGLALNPHDWEAAKSPAGMDVTNKLAKLLPKHSGRGKQFTLPYNSFVNRAKDRNNNMAGAANIGPNAKGNITGAFLTKHDYELNVPINFGSVVLTGYSGAMDKDFILEEVDGKLAVKMDSKVGADGKLVMKAASGAKRKQDTSSDMISTATDNAKDPKAATINFTLSNLAVGQNLIHLGAGLERITTFLNQPILWELSERQAQAGSLAKGFEEQGDVLRNMLKEYNDLLKGLKIPENVVDGMQDEVLVKNISGKLKNYVTGRNGKGKAVSYGKVADAEVEFLVQQIDVLRKYQELDTFTTQSFAQVGRLLALTKGVGSDFQSLDKFQTAVQELTWKDLNTGEDQENKVRKTKPDGSDAPVIELDNILPREHMLRANIEHLGKVIRALPDQFLLRKQTVRDFQKKMRGLGMPSNSVAPFQNELLAFLAVSAWQHNPANGKLADKQYLLTDKDNNICAERDRLLATYPDLRTNPFIQNTRNQPASNSNPLNKLIFNTRSSLEREVTESITDGYVALFSDTRPGVRDYAKNIFYYEGVLNNWQFKNDSTIKLLPATLHTGVSNAMKTMLDSGIGYSTVGMSNEDALHEFAKHYWGQEGNRIHLSEYGKSYQKLKDRKLMGVAKNTINIDFSTVNVEDKKMLEDLAKLGYTYHKKKGWNLPEFLKVMKDEESYMEEENYWAQANAEIEAEGGSPLPKPEPFMVYERTNYGQSKKQGSYRLLAVERSATGQSTYHLPVGQKASTTAALPQAVAAPVAASVAAPKPAAVTVEFFKGFWTRQQVEAQTGKIFLFGDNTDDRTRTKYVPSSTQAVIRGLPNALGIDTKKTRGTDAAAYFTDNDFEEFKQHVDSQMRAALASGKTIVIPEDGIGTGKAMLAQKAPRLNAYLQKALARVKELGSVPAAPAVEEKPVVAGSALASLPAYTPGQKTMTYAGVGSRETPGDVLGKMSSVAKRLAELGYTLQSGGAEGADKAFEAGATAKNIFYARDAANDARAQKLVDEIHPMPAALKEFPRNLMARNAYQVFGKNLDTPVDFVLAYTKDGVEEHGKRTRGTGGTGQAISLASLKGIPVINLANPGWEQRIAEILGAKKTANPDSHLAAIAAATQADQKLTEEQQEVFDKWEQYYPNMAHYTPQERIRAIQSMDNGTSNISC